MCALNIPEGISSHERKVRGSGLEQWEVEQEVGGGGQQGKSGNRRRQEKVRRERDTWI